MLGCNNSNFLLSAHLMLQLICIAGRETCCCLVSCSMPCPLQVDFGLCCTQHPPGPACGLASRPPSLNTRMLLLLVATARKSRWVSSRQGVPSRASSNVSVCFTVPASRSWCGRVAQSTRSRQSVAIIGRCMKSASLVSHALHSDMACSKVTNQ